MAQLTNVQDRLGRSGTAVPMTAVQRTYLRRAIVASTVGTVIEWYDYGLFASASGLIFNRLFFPQLSHTAGILASFATFGVGFFMRPVGGVVIGHIGDRFGRKPALIVTVVLMGLASAAVGCLPTYDQIGIWAPVLLVVLRLLQGSGAGAELAGAITLVAEYAPPKNRAIFTVFPMMATQFGLALAMLCFFVVGRLLPTDVVGWAWRIPFLLSIVLFAVALYIRYHLEETPEYVVAMAKARARKEAQRVPIAELFRNNFKEVTTGFLAMVGSQAFNLVMNGFALSYMTNTLAMTANDSLIVLMIALISTCLCGPPAAAVSDRIGSWKVFFFGAAWSVAMAFPLFALIDTKNMLLGTIGVSVIYGVSWGCTGGAQGAFLSNLFPIRCRYSGIAMSRELSGAYIGGATPFIATALVAAYNGRPAPVAVLLMGIGVVSMLAIWLGKHLARHTG